MDKYHVAMIKSAGLTETERRARWGRVYRFLLSLGSKTAERERLDSNTRPAASMPAPSREGLLSREP